MGTTLQKSKFGNPKYQFGDGGVQVMLNNTQQGSKHH